MSTLERRLEELRPAIERAVHWKKGQLDFEDALSAATERIARAVIRGHLAVDDPSGQFVATAVSGVRDEHRRWFGDERTEAGRAKRGLTATPIDLGGPSVAEMVVDSGDGYGIDLRQGCDSRPRSRPRMEVDWMDPVGDAAAEHVDRWLVRLAVERLIPDPVERDIVWHRASGTPQRDVAETLGVTVYRVRKNAPDRRIADEDLQRALRQAWIDNTTHIGEQPRRRSRSFARSDVLGVRGIAATRVASPLGAGG